MMEPLHTKVSVNEFVLRQVKGSGKTYANELSFKKIAEHAQTQLAKGQYKTGYRDGILLAKTDKTYLKHFICPFVNIDENSNLRAKIIRRRDEEEPYIQIRSLNGSPLKTGSVDLILYHHQVLAETNEQSTNSDWELISFHAIPDGINSMPMGAITMMRNQLQLAGGTKAHYSSDEWAKSILFWQKYAVLI